MHELSKFLEQLEALTPKDAHKSSQDRLDQLLATWRRTGVAPDDVGRLSGGEYRALMLAFGQEHHFESSIAEFLVLDGWLQRWVLKSRGWGSFIGSKLGV